MLYCFPLYRLPNLACKKRVTHRRSADHEVIATTYSLTLLERINVDNVSICDDGCVDNFSDSLKPFPAGWSLIAIGTGACMHRNHIRSGGFDALNYIQHIIGIFIAQTNFCHHRNFSRHGLTSSQYDLMNLFWFIE